MCRMCLVEVKGPRGFALSPACFVPVADGQEVVTDSPKVKKAQDGVLEFLLINHPLDCPVCDKGGECPLQDQTFAFGPGESRMVEEKRHWEKPIPINPLVLLDRERCIQCARCTRFADEIAGDAGIDFIGRADATEVNTFPDEPFESYFSGNIVQICPVGALTATPYRFKARPWDLEQVESTCTLCAVGLPHRGAVVAEQPHPPPRHRQRAGEPRLAVRQGTVRLRGHRLRRPARPPRSCGGGRQPRRGVVDRGPRRPPRRPAQDHRHLRPGGGRRARRRPPGQRGRLRLGRAGRRRCSAPTTSTASSATACRPRWCSGLPRATIDEACAASAVLLLGPDLKEELPVLYLRLREAVVDKGVPLVELVPAATGLTGYATVSLVHRPGEAATVARALATARNGARVPPEVAGGVSAAAILRAAEVLGAVNSDGGGVVVVLGRPSLAESASATVDAAGVLAQALPGVRFLSALRRANVHGALDMGLAPGLLPGRVSLDDGRAWFADPSAWGSAPASPGLDTVGILQAAVDRRHPRARAARRRPARRLPRPRPGPPGPRAVAFTVAVDSFATRRCGAPTWCCPPPASPSGRAPPPTSRDGSPGSARRSPPPARPGPTG